MLPSCLGYKCRKSKCCGLDPCQSCELSSSTCKYFPEQITSIWVLEKTYKDIQQRLSAIERVCKELIPSERARESLFYMKEVSSAVIEEILQNALMLRRQPPCLTVSTSDMKRTLPVSFEISFKLTSSSST